MFLVTFQAVDISPKGVSTGSQNQWSLVLMRDGLEKENSFIGYQETTVNILALAPLLPVKERRGENAGQASAETRVSSQQCRQFRKSNLGPSGRYREMGSASSLSLLLVLCQEIYKHHLIVCLK